MATYKPSRKKIERRYYAALNRIAENVGQLVESYDVVNYPQRASTVRQQLEAYSAELREWARETGRVMVAAAEREDEKLWGKTARELSRNIRAKIDGVDMSETRQILVAEQVELIQSIPTEAAERVSQLSLEALAGGSRGQSIERELLNTSDVTKARARLIARTETARATTQFTESRAQSVGSEEYIWRTAGDADVRLGHRAVANKTFRWDSPPAVKTGDRTYHHHPGEIFNCRCYPEPLIPE